jgi:hypothetical protein
MNKLFVTATVLALLAGASAEAQVNFDLNIGTAAPVVMAPPAPVVVAPPPVVVQQPGVVYVDPHHGRDWRYWQERRDRERWEHEHPGAHWDHDRWEREHWDHR